GVVGGGDRDGDRFHIVGRDRVAETQVAKAELAGAGVEGSHRHRKPRSPRPHSTRSCGSASRATGSEEPLAPRTRAAVLPDLELHRVVEGPRPSRADVLDDVAQAVVERPRWTVAEPLAREIGRARGQLHLAGAILEVNR